MDTFRAHPIGKGKINTFIRNLDQLVETSGCTLHDASPHTKGSEEPCDENVEHHHDADGQPLNMFLIVGKQPSYTHEYDNSQNIECKIHSLLHLLMRKSLGLSHTSWPATLPSEIQFWVSDCQDKENAQWQSQAFCPMSYDALRL